jgi:ABC-type lipopolysaccharide export system ATPase subunit
VSELLAVCDRAALLVDGRVEVTDEPARFANHPAVQRRYLT